jgi:nucleotide-binding universal stress UspA family protein
MSPAEYDALSAKMEADGWTAVEHAADVLGVEEVELVVQQGDPGPALCALADELSVGAIVMGSRGRGGLTRALLGSVSDYVVRNATCTVVITRPDAG